MRNFQQQVNASLYNIKSIRARMETDPAFKAAMLQGMFPAHKGVSPSPREDATGSPLKQFVLKAFRLTTGSVILLSVVSGIGLIKLLFKVTHIILMLFYGLYGFGCVFFYLVVSFFNLLHVKGAVGMWPDLWHAEKIMGFYFLLGFGADIALHAIEYWLFNQTSQLAKLRVWAFK